MALDPIRPTDDDARALARLLLRCARSGALGTLTTDGRPSVSLTATATAFDGTPVILISRLSGHTGNLQRDGRCSLLLGQGGRGDPLAHPRMTIMAQARFLTPEEAAGNGMRRRFLAQNPKAALYVDFPDFAFVALAVEGASLNGGFGKAYELAPGDFLSRVDDAEGLADAEEGAIAHMNEDHAEAISLYATRLARRPAGAWRITGIDPDGMVLQAGEMIARVDFPRRVSEPGGLRRVLHEMAEAARASA